MIRYPNIIGKTDAQKLEQMRSYLHQLADELNFQLDKTGNLTSGYAPTANDIAKAVEKKNDPVSNFNDIKALIIKSADIVDAYYTEISKKLEGQYVAESEFGTFKETTEAQLTASSDRIEVALTKQETIEQDMDELERTMRSEISQTADSIKLEVIDGTPGNTATIKLTVGDNVYSGTIDMTGLVTFNNLETAGQTVINGSNITTGEILADLIKAGVIRSKDGSSVVIDLDAGEVDITGTFTTKTADDGSGNRCRTRIVPDGIIMQKTDSYGESSLSNLTSTAMILNGDSGRVYASANSTTADANISVFGSYDGSFGEVLSRADGQKALADIILRNPSLSTKLVIRSQKERNYITGLTAPVGASDATNKEYVDNAIADAKTYVGNNFANYRLNNVQPFFLGNNGINLNNVRGNIFAINASNAPYDHGTVVTYTLQGGGFTPNGAKDIVVQEMEDWSTNCRARRKSTDGGTTWGAWAYENPPLWDDVEYLTTERFNNKPVYAKLVTFGALPASGSSNTKGHGISNIHYVISADLLAQGGTNITNHPDIGFYVSNSVIYISNKTSSYAGTTAYVLMKYSKNS